MLRLNPLAILRDDSDGGGTVFKAETGAVFRVNPVGRLIWLELERGTDNEAAICAHLDEILTGGFPASAHGEVSEFLAQLRELGLLKQERRNV